MTNGTRSKALLVVLLSVAFIAISSSAFGAFEIVDLGNSPGAMYSWATDINDTGQIVFTSMFSYGARSWVYTQNGSGFQMMSIGNANDFANLYVGTTEGIYAKSINNSGIVAGTLSPKNMYESRRPFKWNPQTGITQIYNTITPMTPSYGMAMNENGYITGRAELPPYIYREDIGMIRYGTPLTGLNHNGAEGAGINDRNEIVGVSFNNQGQPNNRAFYYNGIDPSKNLGTLGGASSLAIGINNAGLIVGQAELPDGTKNPFIYNVRDDNATMRDLGSLGGVGSVSYAWDINESGVVVGQSSNLAFIWTESTGLVDLNNLIDDPLNEWTLLSAYALNENGQIVGTGLINGEQHAFLLNPVPIPGAVWLFGSGLIGLLGFRKRFSKV